MEQTLLNKLSTEIQTTTEQVNLILNANPHLVDTPEQFIKLAKTLYPDSKTQTLDRLRRKWREKHGRPKTKEITEREDGWRQAMSN